MSTVKAIPEGFGTVTPFLNIKGAADAIEFYKTAFGAEERSRSPGPDGKIMHAELQLGTSKIMISDAMQQPPTTTSLHLYVEDCDALWARATKAGAKIEMPIADQFWGDRYGVVSDNWGNRWAISSHREDPTPEQMKERMAALFAQKKK
jgi:PhnB protein